MAPWENYLNALPEGIHDHLDPHGRCLDIDLNSAQIFSGQDNIEVWRRDRGGENAIKSDFDPEHFDASEDTVYIIHQNNSWSSLKTSVDAVQKILAAYRITPIFLDALRSFGVKVTGRDDPYFNLCDVNVTDEGDNATKYEICYITRAYEKHGRATLKDPWSLRQMAVYHQYDSDTQRSTWILVQPFKRSKEAFLKQFTASKTPHALHKLLMGLSLSDWRWYLNDKRKLINQYNEKALFSSSTYKPVDYDTGFADCQRLHKLAADLSLAQEILKSQEQIASVLHSYSTEQKKQISNCIRHIQGFSRTATALAKHAEGTSLLLSKLLEYRKTDILNSQAITLATLFAQSNAQSNHLQDLAIATRDDSRSMKILAIVATIYLPANLIASIFSSDLVQISQTIPNVNPPLLFVPPAMWIFVISSLALTGVTMLGIYLWVRTKRP